MKIPFLKCVSCSDNNGNTQIKIRSNCLSKPLIINLDINNNKNLDLLEKILKLLKNNNNNNIVEI